MALPTISFDNLLGSDSQASGAGPASAQFGTNCRNRNASEARFGLYEGTPPNLAGVSDGGEHVLWVQNTSGRKFTRILGKKDTQQTLTGNISSGASVITSPSSTAGLAVNDLIRVAGAGAAGADLYSKIASINPGVSINLSDSASTTVSGASCVAPKYVTCEDSLTLSAGVAWAIGGKRRTLAHADSDDLLAADAKSGWVVVLVQTGTPYQMGKTIGVGADTTLNPVVLMGSGASRPEVTSSTVATMTIGSSNSGLVLRFLKITHTGTQNVPAIDITSSGSRGFTFVNCDISNVATGGSACAGVRHNGPAAWLRCVFRDCYLHDCAGGAFVRGTVGTTQSHGVAFYNCFFANNAVGGIDLMRTRGLLVWDCIFYANAEEVHLRNDANGDSSGSVLFFSTFDKAETSGPGITYQSAKDGPLMMLMNNIICRHRNSFAVSAPGGASIWGFWIGYNSVGDLPPWVNNPGVYSVFDVWDWDGLAPTEFPDEASNDPGFIDAEEGGLNYALGKDAVTQRAYPPGEVETIGRSSNTRSYGDMGASQQFIRPPLIAWEERAL